MTEFKTFRDFCLKNDELIRLHSLIHCNKQQSGGGGNGDANSSSNAVITTVVAVADDDDLQDIADYVRDELQDELDQKDVVCYSSGGGSVGVLGYIDANNDFNVVQENVIVDEQHRAQKQDEIVHNTFNNTFH